MGTRYPLEVVDSFGYLARPYLCDSVSSRAERSDLDWAEFLQYSTASQWGIKVTYRLSSTRAVSSVNSRLHDEIAGTREKSTYGISDCTS